MSEYLVSYNYSVTPQLDLYIYFWATLGFIPTLIMTVVAIFMLVHWIKDFRVTKDLNEREKERQRSAESEFVERNKIRVCRVCNKKVNDFTSLEWFNNNNRCKKCYAEWYNSPEQQKLREIERARREREKKKHYRRMRRARKCQNCGKYVYFSEGTHCTWCNRKVFFD